MTALESRPEDATANSRDLHDVGDAWSGAQWSRGSPASVGAERLACHQWQVVPRATGHAGGSRADAEDSVS
jgi:hypothetical protein